MSARFDQDVPGPRRDLVGYGRSQPRVRWPDGANLALNFVVNYEEGSEYTYAFGDERSETWAELPGVPGQRDLTTESVYEYGSRAGVWRVLGLLEELEIESTFFATGLALERNPAVGEAIRVGNHEACSHGWRWIEHWGLSREEEREQIEKAIRAITRTCGERPLGWYCRYGPSVNTRELVVEEGGFVYDSDAYNDDYPYFTYVAGRRHLVVPYNVLPYNDVRFVSPQGYSAPGDFREICVAAIDELRREGAAGHPKMLSIGVHPRWIGQPGRTVALRDVLAHARDAGDVWLAKRIDIARWWIDHYTEFGLAEMPINEAELDDAN